MTEEIRKELGRLTDGDRAVLDAYCDLAEKTTTLYAAMARKLSKSEGAIKSRMHVIFSKLGLLGLPRDVKRTRLLEDYCPVFREGDLGEPAPEEGEPPELDPDQIIEVLELEFPIVPAGPPDKVPDDEIGEKPIVIIEPSTQRVARPWHWLLIGALVGGLVVLAILFGVGLFPPEPAPGEELDRGPRDAPGISVSEVVEVIREVTVIVTNTPGPSPATQPAVIETVLIPVTNTPVPPTATPMLSLPFQDDFSQPLGPWWRTLSGKHVIISGELGAADGDVTLEIGDASWPRFNVEFDYINLSDNRTMRLYFGGRVQFFANKNVERWWSFEEDEWVRFFGCEGCGLGSNGHLKVAITEGGFEVFVDGFQYREIFYEVDVTGPFAIELMGGTRIDDLRITATD